MMYGDWSQGFLWMLIIAVGIGMAIMAILVWLIPWIWEFVKPWLHLITA